MFWCSFQAHSEATPAGLRAEAAAPEAQHHPRPSGERCGGATRLFADAQPPAQPASATYTRRSIRRARTAWTRIDLPRVETFLLKLGAAALEWSLVGDTNCDLRPKFHVQSDSPVSVHTAAPAGPSRPRPWFCCLRRLDRPFSAEVRGNPAAKSVSVRGG